jgi:hypothetical protein
MFSGREWNSTIAYLSGTMTGPIITSGDKLFELLDFPGIMRQISAAAERIINLKEGMG